MGTRYRLIVVQVRTRSCEVGLNTVDCENPPGSDGEDVRTKCYRCGKVACRGCSMLALERTASGKRRWIRICNDCLEQETKP